MVALDEYSFRGLGHNGVVDNCLHHSRTTLEYAVGVSEEAHKEMDMPSMVTRDGTLTWDSVGMEAGAMPYYR